MIKKTKSGPKTKLFIRLVPTLVGLYIIGSFLYSSPDQAKKLYTTFISRFTGGSITTTKVTPPEDEAILAQINQKRQDKKLADYSINPQLSQLSKLYALDIANSKTSQPTLDLEKTAKAMGITYSQIAYLVIIQSQSSIKNLSQMLWEKDNETVLLSSKYQSIGIHSIESKDENQSIITVITFASLTKPQTVTSKSTQNNTSYYTGVQLWSEIQKYRKNLGVPEFRQDNTLCTLTSIRVNQLLKINALDDHKGFEPLVDQYRSEGKLDFGNLGENILMGYPTAAEAVKAWDGSLGHKALMSDGSYVWACASANHGFAVLIAAY